MKAHWKLSSLIAVVLLGMSAWQLDVGRVSSYFQAWLTENLLQTAWIRTQATGHEVKPWPWAETWPLARLLVPHLHIDQIILAHASQGIFPFAMGHLDSSVLPGEVGNSNISVHRDTYFSFLQSLKPGDTLILESFHSGRWRYEVSGVYIVSKTDTRFLEPSSIRRLTLVSCYPCNDVDDLLRYVVIADEAERII
jgi:sortase A